MKKVLYVDSLEDMNRLSKAIAEAVFPGFVIGLTGDLGAGKTTFTQYFGKHIGIDDAINSPTFTLMKHYQGDYFLSHIDAYRLEGAREDASLEEYIDSDGVCVVEWYTYIDLSMPETFLALNIEHLGDEKRRVTLEGNDRYEDVVNNLSY